MNSASWLPLNIGVSFTPRPREKHALHGSAYQNENICGVPHLLAVEHHQQHQRVPDDAEDGDDGEDDGHDVRDQHLEAGLHDRRTSFQPLVLVVLS